MLQNIEQIEFAYISTENTMNLTLKAAPCFSSGNGLFGSKRTRFKNLKISLKYLSNIIIV